MDWLTVGIIIASVIGIIVLIGYVRKGRKNRRFESLGDVSVGNCADGFSSGNGLAPKLGGGSGGGAGATRSFAASTTELAGGIDAARIITVNSIVTGELNGDLTSNKMSENMLPSPDIAPSLIESTSTTIGAEGMVTAAVEFMADTAVNAIEVAGEVVGVVTEVAGEVVGVVAEVAGEVAGVAAEVAGEVVGVAVEVAGEIISEFISNS